MRGSRSPGALPHTWRSVMRVNMSGSAPMLMSSDLADSIACRGRIMAPRAIISSSPAATGRGTSGPSPCR